MKFYDVQGNEIYLAKLVTGQTYRIRAVLGVSIAGASSKQFGYRKPGGSIAYWTASVADEATGDIYYDVQSAENDTPGTWTAWYKVVQADGKVLEIPAQSFLVIAEGQAA
jgi:hypothetical protein